jgi:diacylglycerol kinase (ATP)
MNEGSLEDNIINKSIEQLVEKPKYIQVIINPAAGKDQPILKTLNAAFRSAGADWDVNITKKRGDGTKYAREAVEDGADVVVVHGGDGSVMEVAAGLMGTNVPMAIVPGGTANVMSRELGIPPDLLEACTLIVNRQAYVRKVDMGRVGSHHFLLRVGMGLEAAMIETADREMKDRLGLLAYAFSALQELASPQIAKYHFILDGQEAESEGLACLVANSGNIGAAGISIVPGMDVSDGMLDVIVVTKSDLPSLIALAASVVGGLNNTPALQHWRVKKVSIRSEPSQNVQVDGEILEKTPVDIEVIPHAVKIIVPPSVIH